MNVADNSIKCHILVNVFFGGGVRWDVSQAIN